MSAKFLNQVKLSSAFTTSNTPVVANDDGQTALQKLQGQINILAPIGGAETVFNGIENAALFSVSYSASTKVFSVTYSTGAAYTVSGTRYAPTAGTVTTVPHSSTAGMYFLYYDPSGTLVVTSTAWDLLTDAPLASAYYNPSNIGGAAAGVLQYEMHAGIAGMSNATHKNLHLTRGTQLLNGCVATGYTLNSGGDANVNWTTTGGNVADEDLTLSVATQALGGANNYRILYLTGTTANPVWNWKDTAESGVYSDGTNIYYNQNNAGTWQLTSIAANSRWVNYYILATTAYSAPQIIVVMGQVLYSSSTTATTGTFATDVLNFGLFTSEAVVLYKVTYRRVSGDGAPGNAEISSFTRLIQSLVTVGVGGTVSASNVTVSTGSFVNFFGPTDGNAQQCFNDIDANIKGITITGTAAGITGGLANYIPYQTAANTTSFITPVNSAVLVSSAAGVPSLSTTLPAVTAGAVLVTDPTTSSSAALDTALSNINAGTGGISINVQTFTSSGTYTPISGMKYCTIECWGGGGGGGGSTGYAGIAGGSAGGGAGGYSRKTVSAATIGASQTVTIGALGAGGTAGSASTGGTGGATSVGTLCIANGGSGAAGPGTTSKYVAGLGGTAGTGDITGTGQSGGTCPMSTNYNGEYTNSSCGGSSSIGGGGVSISSEGSMKAGSPGTGYGSGGAGVVWYFTTGSVTGGDGTPGYVAITEYL